MRKNLTDRFVRFVTPTERQTDYWDTTLTGFGLRVSPGGKKVFEIYYRRNRQQRRMAVGPFPVLSLADARRLAKNLLADVAKGSDPATIKRADRHAETFAELSKSCLDELKRQNRSWQEAERIINVELLPAWKTRNANQITRKEIRALGQRIVDRGSGVMANRTLSVIHRIFRHGVENEWCQQNPCHGIKKLTVEHS